MTAALQINLTKREHDILTGLAAGKPYHEIAGELGRSADVIRRQATRMFRKLGARNATNAVDIAHRRGLLGGGQ